MYEIGTLIFSIKVEKCRIAILILKRLKKIVAEIKPFLIKDDAVKEEDKSNWRSAHFSLRCLVQKEK